MIKINRATKEARSRDKKRGRFILSVGKKKIHMTFAEVLRLRSGIDRAIVQHCLCTVKL